MCKKPSYETGSEIFSMLESFSMKYASYHLALFFLSPSLPRAIFSIPPLPLPCPLFFLLYPLKSSSLLPSTFFPLSLPPFSPGSGTFSSLHWLPLYLQGTNRTARTGEGTCMNKHLVRKQHPQSCSRLPLLQV